MIPLGTPGVKSEVVLSSGQWFASLSAFADACGIDYTTVYRHMRRLGKDVDTIARERGVLQERPAVQQAAE